MNKAAFSLVELSIVLVILGLLTGGILTGQSLIKAAELRAIPTELNQIQTAINTFEGKYFALPGDMPNATAFWTSAGGNGEDDACFAVASTGTETCNGDGNGEIAHHSDDLDRTEWTRSWQHLSNAGMIKGQYSGVFDAANPENAYYRSKYPSALWMVNWVDEGYGSADPDEVFPTLYGSHLAALDGGYGLRPEDMWNLDKKLDDGLPNKGRVQSKLKGNGSDIDCTDVGGVSPPGDEDAQYAFSNSAGLCIFIYYLN
jgi:prepilin-type N-terminal cleavage/methylation domain-containing protein